MRGIDAHLRGITYEKEESVNTTEHLDRIEGYINLDNCLAEDALESLRAIRQQFEGTGKAHTGSPDAVEDR